MIKISYRVKDVADNTFLDNESDGWSTDTFTSFGTLEEAKQAVKYWDDTCDCRIVKVTTRPVSSTTGHDWNWAQKQLAKGKSVRRLDWTTTTIWLATGKWGQIFILDHTPSKIEFAHNTEDCTATDWVLTDA